MHSLLIYGHDAETKLEVSFFNGSQTVEPNVEISVKEPQFDTQVITIESVEDIDILIQKLSVCREQLVDELAKR